jgi:hypothetical protein
LECFFVIIGAAMGGAVVTTGAGAGAGAGAGDEQAASARAERSPAALSDQRVETKRM